MSASPKQHAIRRSTRLPLEVPILVTSLDPSMEFSEECKTTLVNAHGCGLITQNSLPRDLPVRLEIVPSKRQTTARVADVVSLGGSPETWLLGMELDEPGNFWGIEYAPSDWKIEEVVAPEEESVPVLQSAPVAESVPAPRRWRLTDISAGACYLEGGAPLPVGTAVLVSVRVANRESLLDGVVRASHLESGMGIEFTSENHNHATRAEELIARLTSQHEVPRVFVGRKEEASEIPEAPSATFTGESYDPLLDLIRYGDSIPVEKFLEDLKAQRLGDRAEPRVDIEFEIQLSGIDVNGKPFEEAVKTMNISRSGAQLCGIQARLQAGETVSISRENRGEEFRVAWVGASLTPLAGQIGVVAAASGTSLWGPGIHETANQNEATSVRKSATASKE